MAGSLVMERDENGEWVMSLNRVAFWLVLLPALGIWVYGGGKLSADGQDLRDVSEGHLNILLSLIAINFGKKSLDTVNKVWGKTPPEKKTVVDEENNSPG